MSQEGVRIVKERSLHTILKCWEILGCYTLLAWSVGIVTVVNFINAVTGYDMDLFGGFSAGLCTVYAMILTGVGLFIVLMYSGNYQFLNVIPLKSSTVPMQMSLLLDLVHGLVLLLDVMVLLLCAQTALLPMRLLLAIMVYAIAHIGQCCIPEPGLRSTNMQEVRKGKGFLLYILYVISMIAVMVLNMLVSKILMPWHIAAVVLPAAAVAAAIIRVVTYRVLRNKVRLVKTYKPKKQKLESYV